jgi:hypothetical protein
VLILFGIAVIALGIWAFSTTRDSIEQEGKLAAAFPGVPQCRPNQQGPRPQEPSATKGEIDD